MKKGMVCLTVGILFTATAAAAQEPRMPAAEAFLQGERIYRDGVLPSGEPVEAFVEGDIPVIGTAFTCANCHMRSGLGSIEGGVITTPTTGALLYRPYTGFADLPMATVARMRRLNTASQSRQAGNAAPLPRPAYTDATLARALRLGVGPTGRMLDPIMPRYLLDDPAMGLLVGYLKRLSSATSPGVDDTTLRLATIVGPGVDPKAREAMLKTLEDFIRQRNGLLNYFRSTLKSGNRSRLRMLARDNDPGSLRQFELDVWELAGPAESWRAQLEARLSARPVFAVVGGMVTGEWLPIQEFCDAQRLPCILPLTDLPAVAADGGYTLYFTRGYRQEGESVARYLSKVAGLPPEAQIVQIRRDTPEGRALADGFTAVWRKLGGKAPELVTLGPDQEVGEYFLSEVSRRLRPSAVLLWLGEEALGALGPGTASLEGRPPLFLSGMMLQERLWQISEAVRESVYITWPFRLPQDKRRPAAGRGKQPFTPDPFEEHRAATRSLALTRLLADVFMTMKGYYYRDYFLDLVDSMGQRALTLPVGTMSGPNLDFGQMTFGPGQRYAAKGCSIVQLGPGASPPVIERGGWIIH